MTRKLDMTKIANSLGWLTVAEVAGKLNLSKMSVYRLIEHREITSYRFGRAYRIKPDDLEKYIARNLYIGEPSGS